MAPTFEEQLHEIAKQLREAGAYLERAARWRTIPVPPGAQRSFLVLMFGEAEERIAALQQLSATLPRPEGLDRPQFKSLGDRVGELAKQLGEGGRC